MFPYHLVSRAIKGAHIVSFVIFLDTIGYLADGCGEPRPPLSNQAMRLTGAVRRTDLGWTRDLSRAACYHTAEDAHKIADFLWRRKTVLGGHATYDLDAAKVEDGTLRPLVRVMRVEMTWKQMAVPHSRLPSMRVNTIVPTYNVSDVMA